jgi:hypothetical protein
MEWRSSIRPRYPGRGRYGLLNLAITAVKGAGAAAGANGVSISLDAAAQAEVKAVIAAIEKV